MFFLSFSWLDIEQVDDLSEESWDFPVENLWCFITECRRCFWGWLMASLTAGWNIRINVADHLLWFVTHWTVELNIQLCSLFTTFGIYALNLFDGVEVSESTDLESEDQIVQFVQNLSSTNNIAHGSQNIPAWASEAQIRNNSNRIGDVHPLHLILMARPYSDIYLSALVISKPWNLVIL